MSLWTAADAAKATGGKARGDWAATGVSIDTRTIQEGDLFVALKDLRDGHDFVAQALAKGAAAALVSRVPEGVANDAPLLVVDNVLRGLEDLGRAARKRSSAKVVGVTGSVGKTSTKEMLRIVLGGQGKTHAAEASYNNHWGVPLTLARLPADAAFAIIEIGMNHPGEIGPLAQMAKPDIALITTVAPAHLEAFDNIDGIAREKAAIFDGLAKGGVALVNADMGTAELVAQIAKSNAIELLNFGQSGNADFEATKIALVDQTTIVHCKIRGEKAVFKIGAPGKHFAMNALASIGVADCLGLDLAVALGDIGRWVPPKGRGTRERIVMDVVEDHLHFDLIDDAFNANPTSMIASLEVLAAAKTGPNGRRIAVLGDMLELGPDEMNMHRALGETPFVAQLDVIHCVGPRMRALYDVLPEAQQGRWCETAQELAQSAHAIVRSGDVLLVKGSKGSQVSLIVDAVRKLGHVAPMSEQEGS
jgi:UDP-N-acetylmuramoyl-tripeptide--D-alanyl-D-alanine ligase